MDFEDLSLKKEVFTPAGEIGHTFWRSGPLSEETPRGNSVRWFSALYKLFCSSGCTQSFYICAWKCSILILLGPPKFCNQSALFTHSTRFDSCRRFSFTDFLGGLGLGLEITPYEWHLMLNGWRECKASNVVWTIQLRSIWVKVELEMDWLLLCLKVLSKMWLRNE